MDAILFARRGAAGSLALLWVSGCADPCFDDGLAQGGCPRADLGETSTEGTSTGGASTGGASTTGTSITAGETEGSSSDPTRGTGGGDGFVCPSLDEILVPSTPTIQLVVDRSGSMDQEFGGPTRWEAVVETLMNGDAGVVPRLQSDIRFGLTLYTAASEGSCPVLESLAPQLDAADELTAIFEDNGPGGETPTGAAIEAATALLEADPWQGDKFLVLATDGEPDTCEEPAPETDEEIAIARGTVVTAVEAAYAAGIETFVISVGDEIADEHLQALANAGVGAAAGEESPFYTALDSQSLVDAFDAIVSGVRDCELALADPLQADLAGTCSVTVNETEVGYDDPDGWRLVDENAIELVGAACDSIQAGVVVITMTCDCEARG